MKSASFMVQPATKGGYEKKRDEFAAVFLRHLESCRLDTAEKVLVIGGSRQDVEFLLKMGFADITLSNFKPETSDDTPANPNLDSKLLAIDAEQIGLPDGSFDFVFAHEVLHHCRSPHRALCEMLRVARKHVVLLEPNDSFMMRMLTWSGFSFPYEIFAVAYHGYEAGGVRHSCIPNFIYRWTPNEVRKTVSSYLAEYISFVHPYPYWDFSVGEEGLRMRKETRIHAITAILGTTSFLAFLRTLQIVLNGISFLRKQGNKFFCCVEKTEQLRPWLVAGNGTVAFNRAHQSSGTNGTAHHEILNGMAATELLRATTLRSD